MRWYYSDGSKQVGPIDEPDVIRLMQSGQIRGATQVWKEGTPSWVSAVNSDIKEHLLPEPPPMNPTPPPMTATTSFNSGGRLVTPRNPPRSVGWMTFWGFIWPGLGQALCGQGSKGAVLMVASLILSIVFSFTLVIPLAICVAGAIDANKVAKRLAMGKPVGEWEFFPNFG
jgi:TM2 domain-containing membrane protein YozV